MVHYIIDFFADFYRFLNQNRKDGESIMFIKEKIYSNKLNSLLN